MEAAATEGRAPVAARVVLAVSAAPEDLVAGPLEGG